MHDSDCSCRICVQVREIVAEAPPLTEAQKAALVNIVRRYAPASQDPHPLDRARHLPSLPLTGRAADVQAP